jgi:hypothetical protein
LAQVTDTSDDPTHAQLPRDQRHEQVPFVVVDHRYQDVTPSDVFALEKLEIRPVAVEHERPSEPGGERFSPGLALDSAKV